MREESLNGLTTKTHQVKKGADPQFCVLTNVSKSAKLKVEVTKEIGDDEKLFKSINIPFLLEAQNKIERATKGGILKQFELATVKDTLNADIVVVKEAKIDFAHGGEISLGQNDTVDIYATNLGKVASSKMFTFEGTGVSQNVYEIKERTFKSDEPQQKVDLATTHFLVLDVDKMPSEIEFRVNAQKITRTKEALLIDQKDKYNTIGYDQNQKAIFGYYKAIVIDVRACSEVIMEDETDPRTDIKYYTVKTPH